MTGGSPPDRLADPIWRRTLLAIVVVAAAARVALIIATPHFAPWGDPADYQLHAASIAGGHGYPTSAYATPGTPSAYRPPGYPYVLGIFYAIFGVHLTAGRLLGAALGVLVVVLIAYLGRAIWNGLVGLIAASLAAVFLPLIALNGTLLSESLMLPLELGVALCALALAQTPDRLRWALLAGALCALSALTRPVAVLWLLPCLAACCYGRWTSRGRKVRSAAALISAFALVVTPWTIRNADAFHTFVPLSTEDGFTLAGEYNDVAGANTSFDAVWQVPLGVPSLHALVAPLLARPGGVNEEQVDHTLEHAGLSYIRRHPSQVLFASALNALRMIGIGPAHQFTDATAYRELGLPHSLQEATTLSAQIVLLLAIAGVITGLSGRLPLRLGASWLWAIPLLALIATVPFSGTPRYRAPLDPFLLLLAAAVICEFAARWHFSDGARR